MSVQTNAEIVKSAFARYTQGGVQAALAYAREDVVWTPHDAPGKQLHGTEEILARHRALAVEGTRVEVHGHAYEDHPSCVVVIGRVRVLGQTGHYDVPMCWQVDVEDGLITRVQAERHVEDAREDCAAAC